MDVWDWVRDRVHSLTASHTALLVLLLSSLVPQAPLMASTDLPIAQAVHAFSTIALHIPTGDLAHQILDTSPVDYPEQSPAPDALLFILPLLIVLSTFLFVLLIFLVCIIFIRRRRGIVLRDTDGPIDMTREELYEGDGGFEGVESRWLESVSDIVRRSYLRAKGPFVLSIPTHQNRPIRPLFTFRLSITVSS